MLLKLPVTVICAPPLDAASLGSTPLKLSPAREPRQRARRTQQRSGVTSLETSSAPRRCRPVLKRTPHAQGAADAAAARQMHSPDTCASASASASRRQMTAAADALRRRIRRDASCGGRRAAGRTAPCALGPCAPARSLPAAALPPGAGESLARAQLPPRRPAGCSSGSFAPAHILRWVQRALSGRNAVRACPLAAPWSACVQRSGRGREAARGCGDVSQVLDQPPATVSCFSSSLFRRGSPSGLPMIAPAVAALVLLSCAPVAVGRSARHLALTVSRVRRALICCYGGTAGPRRGGGVERGRCARASGFARDARPSRPVCCGVLQLAAGARPAFCEWAPAALGRAAPISGASAALWTRHQDRGASARRARRSVTAQVVVSRQVVPGKLCRGGGSMSCRKCYGKGMLQLRSRALRSSTGACAIFRRG